MEASAVHAPQGLRRVGARGPLLRLRSDDQLVALFRMGYDDAFRVIFDRYRQRLFAYTRQMLGGSRSDAEDALQDVFLRAYSALRYDDRPVTLRAWLYRVAHNRCVDELRRPVPPPADVFDVSRSPLLDPTAQYERREDLRRLVADVRRLPEQQRSALLMRELQGLTYQELADALGVTLSSVKSLLVRARIGLVEADTARDTACTEIRGDLDHAHDRGVRCGARARRHLRDCGGCRDYHRALRGTRTRALAGAPPGPLATVAKILGIGGAGSGAAAGTGAGVGASAGLGGAASGGLVATGVAAGTATKVAAVLCCAAMVGGGAAEVRTKLAPAHTAPRVHRAAAAALAATPPAALPAARPAPLRPAQAAAHRDLARRALRQAAAHAEAPAVQRVTPAALDPTRQQSTEPVTEPAGAPVTTADDPVGDDGTAVTGGTVAPDEPAAPVPAEPAAADPPTGTTADAATSQPPAAPAATTGTTGAGDAGRAQAAQASPPAGGTAGATAAAAG